MINTLQRTKNYWAKILVSLLVYVIGGFPTLVFALPQHGKVVAGAASIELASPDRLNVIQSTDKAIIDWDSFNIDTQEHTDFQQPSSNSINLSRVTSGIPSDILGKLTSNGKLFLINPSGVLFGENSHVDVNGLVATTSNIRNGDFMAGRYNFNIAPSSPATVINRGRINVAEGGLLALVAPGVENAGFINARLGQVSLASGNTFTLDLYGDQLVHLGIHSKVAEQVKGPNGAPLTALVTNSGSIMADGGAVTLDVHAARGIVDNVINMSGFIEARAASVEANGEIVLRGGDEGIVRVAGTLDASGKGPGQKGGLVQVLGKKVGLFENARIDASGAAGGGTVLVGGDYQGSNPSIQNAFRTFAGKNTTILADALSSGNGGKVILWADDITRFHGAISAQGGNSRGDGGFVEVSGKAKLDFDGRVNLRAPNGIDGTLLLDPQDIRLLDPGSDENTLGFTAGVDDTEAFGDDSGDTSKFDVLAGGSFAGVTGTIILQATQDIEVDETFNLNTATGNSNVNLVLQAGRDIQIKKSITADGTGTIHIEADSPHSSAGAADGDGELSVNSGTTVTSGGGAITLIGADFDFRGSVNAGSGNIAIAQSQTGQALALGTASGAILDDGEIDNLVTTGVLTIGQATTKGTDGAGTAASTLTAGAITLDGLTQGSKNITLISNSSINDDDDSGTSIATTGTLTLTSGGAIGNLGGSQGLNTDVAVLAVTGTGGNNVTVDNGSTDLDLGNITTGAGNLSVTAGGTITDSGVITVGGTASFTADVANKSITLDSANAITGAVTFATSGAGGDVSLDNGSTAISLAAHASGAIGGDLTLTTSGATTLANAVTLNGGALSVTVSGAGNLTVNAAMDSSAANGTITLDAGTGTLTTAAAGTLASGSGGITLTADTVALDGTITGTGALTVQPTTGTATIGIGGTATGTFNLTVAEIAEFQDGFSSITIGKSGGSGAVDLNATTFNDPITINGGAMVIDNLSAGSNAVTLVSSGVIDDADGDATNLTTTGTLTLTSNGAIGGLNLLNIDVGTVTVTSSGGNNVLITDQGTSDTTFSVSTGGGGNLTLTQSAGNMNFGTTSTTGNLTALASTGAIADSGVITVGGTADFTASAANQSITLDSANVISGTVTFATSGAGNVTFDNGSTAIDLGTTTVGGNLAVTAGEAITDSGVLTVGGTASFTTDVANKSITLDSSNAITGAASFSTSGTGDVTFDNGATAINLGTLSIGRNLTLLTDVAQTISNAITLASGALSITVDGAASLTINAALTASNGITLSANDDVIFAAAGDLTSSSGNISVTADSDNGGADSGALTMNAGTVFDAGSGTISLSADEGIMLARLVTSNASNTAVTLTSTEGGIKAAVLTGGCDNGVSAGCNIAAPSGRLVIDTVMGIGDAGSINSDGSIVTAGVLAVDTGSVDIDNTNSGEINLFEMDTTTIIKIAQAGAGNLTVSFRGSPGSALTGQSLATAAGSTVNVVNRASPPAPAQSSSSSSETTASTAALPPPPAEDAVSTAAGTSPDPATTFISFSSKKTITAGATERTVSAIQGIDALVASPLSAPVNVNAARTSTAPNASSVLGTSNASSGSSAPGVSSVSSGKTVTAEATKRTARPTKVKNSSCNSSDDSLSDNQTASEKC